MPLKGLNLVLPCHGAEDFPLHLRGAEAERLRAAWSMLWHPALIDAAKSIPTFASAYDLPEEVADRLIILPEVSRESVPNEWIEKAQSDGATIIENVSDAQSGAAAAISAVGFDQTSFDSELIADFFALGYAQLHVEVLTQHLYYSSDLEETGFEDHLLAASASAVAGDTEKVRERLTACFDALAEARDHYYPLDAHLLDIVLVAGTTIGESLRTEIAKSAGTPVNLLIPPEVLEQIAMSEPETLAVLSDAVREERACVLGGVAEDQRLPLLAPEQILAHLSESLEIYQRHLGTRPRVFASRRYAMSPVMPQILTQLGYTGAWHVSLDGGHVPQTGQSKVCWEGCDTSTVDALMQMPLDASEAAGYLRFMQHMSENIGMDYVATQCFARWPGQRSAWFDDLRRIARHGSVLGKFSTLEDYFENTDMPGEQTRFEADEYAAEYLVQSVKRGDANPISQIVQEHREFATNDTSRRMEAMSMLSGEDGSNSESSSKESLRVTNPGSRVETVLVDVAPLDGLPASCDELVAAAEQPMGKLAVVRVPPFGFVDLVAGDMSSFGSDKLLAEERTLRNDFMEVKIDEHTGAIAAIHDYRTRGNRLSQQLAFRFAKSQRPPDETQAIGTDAAHYSVMAADGVEITQNGTVFAEITSRGRLLELDGTVVSRFVQRAQLWRGSRTLHLDVELEPLREPDADPWASYIAMRFAWPDEAVDIRHSVNMATFVSDEQRIESPWFVELCSPKWRTGIFCAGLPYHRRTGMRMLDSLLSVRGETQRRFRFGIGIDEPLPLPAALALLDASAGDRPPFTLALLRRSESRGEVSASVLQVRPRNLLTTAVEPVVEQGRVVGSRVRLLETEGRAGPAEIQFSRPVIQATKVDLSGEKLQAIEPRGGCLTFEVGGHEWMQLEVVFAP